MIRRWAVSKENFFSSIFGDGTNWTRFIFFPRITQTDLPTEPDPADKRSGKIAKKIRRIFMCICIVAVVRGW